MKGNFSEANEFFSHVLDIEPQHSNALRDSAYVCFAMGRLSEAAEKVRKAGESGENDFKLRFLAARIRLAKRLESVFCWLQRRF